MLWLGNEEIWESNTVYLLGMTIKNYETFVWTVLKIKEKDKYFVRAGKIPALFRKIDL